jgi:DNA-binding response OmpR family regulator
MRALLVESDSSSAGASRDVLETDGLSVDLATTARDGLSRALAVDYDVIVLALDLPDGNGLPVVQELRRQNRTSSILILSGPADKKTTVLALDAGADDFLTKPIAIDEFRARVRSLLRRSRAQRDEQLACGNVVLHRLTRRLFIQGNEVTLTTKELPVLEYLLLHCNEVVTRTELLERVRDLNVAPGSNLLDVNIARLRRKLSDAGADIHIKARRGVGFILLPVDSPTT